MFQNATEIKMPNGEKPEPFVQTEDCKIFVVHGDENYHYGIYEIFSNLGFEVIAYGDIGDFILDFSYVIPSVVVLDVHISSPEKMAEGEYPKDGIKLLELINSKACPPPTIVMTNFTSEEFQIQAMTREATDFISLPCSMKLIEEKVKHFVPLAYKNAEKVKTALLNDDIFAKLAPRQFEALANLLQAKSTKEIAKEMGISPRTVDDYREAISIVSGGRTPGMLVDMTGGASKLFSER